MDINNSKGYLLMQKIYTFYQNNFNYIQIVQTIIEQKSIISLRLLDWFITNYAKQQNIHYNIGDNLFNVHFDYKNQLKAYSKKFFDPFCRRQRIYIYINDDKVVDWSYELKENKEMNIIVTTIGQLNFFKWAIENDIIRFVLKNHNEIENDMTARSNLKKKNGKRRILSKQGKGSVTRNEVKSIIHW